MDTAELCESTKKIVLKTGAFIRHERKHFKASSIEYKGVNDMVSYVDKEAEKQLVEGFSRLIPGSGFVTEEKTTPNSNSQSSEFLWIIDPLDGTTNFIHGLSPFCISVALQKNAQTILGVIYEINLDECFYAYEGGGAFLNKQPISVSEVATPQQSLIGTGFPFTNFSRLKEYMQVFDYCMKNTHGIRRPGSAAADLAYVACGRFDAFFEYGLNSWDVAAGAFIIQQAGGKVTDFSGGGNYLYGREIIATNNRVFDPFFQVIKSSFNP